MTKYNRISNKCKLHCNGRRRGFHSVKCYSLQTIRVDLEQPLKSFKWKKLRENIRIHCRDCIFQCAPQIRIERMGLSRIFIQYAAWKWKTFVYFHIFVCSLSSGWIVALFSIEHHRISNVFLTLASGVWLWQCVYVFISVYIEFCTIFHLFVFTLYCVRLLQVK